MYIILHKYTNIHACINIHIHICINHYVCIDILYVYLFVDTVNRTQIPKV